MHQQDTKEKKPLETNRGNVQTSKNTRRNEMLNSVQFAENTTNSPLPSGTGFRKYGSFKAPGLSVILCLLISLVSPSLLAQTVSMPSALAAPGDTLAIPVRISAEVRQIYGFQLDLDITPSAGAPDLTIERIVKGEAILTTPAIDTYPQSETEDTPLRIGLSVEIPAPPDPKPSFSGPGVLAWIELNIPLAALAGDTYSLNLSKVILAGPGNLGIPVTVYNATITVGTLTIFPDTITGPGSLTVAEGAAEPLRISITGAGEPIPGIPVYFTIANPGKAHLSAGTAFTGADGTAAVMVTGIEDGRTVVHAASSGLPEQETEIIVLGQSPIITSAPLLEMAAGSIYTYDVEASDPNGDALSYTLPVSPAGMTIDPGSGVISWAPPAAWPQAGNGVTVEVRDPAGHTASQSFSIFITVDADFDGYDNRTDCDDANPLINPGALEDCNGIDDNCNGIIDEGVIFDFYFDADGDGYGNPAVSVTGCSPPAGYVLFGGDCNDADPDLNPGRKEIGDNGIDEDCNPLTPDNWSQSFIAAIADNGVIYYAKSNGDGTFSDYRSIRDIGGYNSRGITSGDFNNDGYLDIIAAGGVSGRIDYFLFLNGGNDDFHNQGIVLSQAVSGSWAEDLTSGDFNNDGYFDFIGGADSGQVIVALGNRFGGFTSSLMDLGANSRGLDCADFNNDNHLDLVRARYNDGYGYVYLGNGDGTFGAPLYTGDFGGDPYGVVAADFDNDGYADIIANEGSSGDTCFYKGRGDGTFDQMGYLASLDTNRHGSFDGYDLNNDNNVDVVLSNYNGRRISFYPGNGDGTFGSAVMISPSNTSDNVLAVSAPPYRRANTPFAIIDPPVRIIQAGGTAFFDASISHNRYTGTIVSWEWDFGDSFTGTGCATSHTYGTEEGIYTVTLKVTDDNGQTGIGTAQVHVRGAHPAAEAGGPYSFGEAFANNGIYTVTLDGTSSSDDSAIIGYRWDYGDFLTEAFDGTTTDTAAWIISSGAGQDDAFSLTGTGSWGNRYLFSQQSFLREEGLVFYLKVLPENASGNQYGMFGFKNDNTNYSYNQMPYAIYFINGGIRIYEDGSNRGEIRSYRRTEEYEIKIILRQSGAYYYMKGVSDPFWDLIYISSFSDLDYLKIGATINSGTFTVDEARLYLISSGSEPVRLLEIGSYPVTLTVTDTQGQQDSDAEIINIVANDPPVAHPGGPYTAGETDGIGGEWYIPFDASGSTDDFGILSYVWDFDLSDGLQAESEIINPIHKYTGPGTYTVSLTVTDHALQAHTATAQVVIATSGISPVADPGGPYVVNEESASGGAWTVIMEGCGSSDDLGISRYEWDFGDGTSTTTYYCGEKINGFAAGTDLYGYDVVDAGLRILATENNTKVRIIDLKTGEVTASRTLNQYENWWNAAPGDGRYFKVESDKPLLAYESDFGAHSTFMPSLESGPVGRQFTIYCYTAGSYYVFAYEDAVVAIYNTSGGLVAQRKMTAGSYWSPELGNNVVYRIRSTGRISLQNEGGNAYTSVPAATGNSAGRLFHTAVNGASTGGAFIIFAYENTSVSVYDMDTGELLYEQTLGAGENRLTSGVGTRRLRFESTADIEVWAGDFEGGSSITNLGDDISVTCGNRGQEFYLNSLRDGAVVFAPYNNTRVEVNGALRTLDADGFWHLPGEGVAMHITSSRPVVVQTLGRANAFNDLGTYLGGRSSIRHSYTAPGIYTLTLTVYDNAGLSHTAATTVSVETSDPPAAEHGGPYVLNESHASGGIWSLQLDGSNSSDDYGIYKYEWDFDDSDGIRVDATEPAPVTSYTEPGVYTVTLTVTDHASQASRVTTTVTVLANAPPLAEAGGPYSFGEEAASYGVWTASLDGSRSRDDYRIYSFTWLLAPDIYDFSGTAVNENAWRYSNGVTQNDAVSITGSGSWGSQYLFSKKEYASVQDVIFQARVLPENTSGNQHAMFGIKAVSSNYSYPEMSHAIYFANNNLHIYENGSNRGDKGDYTRNISYDIRITLKETGAVYHYKQANSETWILLYDSFQAAPAYTAIGAVVNSGTFRIEEIRMTNGAQGANPRFRMTEPGSYPVTLTVLDNALQKDTDSTIITIMDGNSPAADAGGPYLSEAGSLLLFNGSGSTDDTGIETYAWTFGDLTKQDGLPFTGKGVAPEHVYREEGVFGVTLVVTDNTGKSATDTTTVTVIRGTPPVAQPGLVYSAGENGPPVYFDGAGCVDDYGIVEYRWDTDDQIDSNNDGDFTNDIDIVGRNPFYVYPAASGAYFNEAFSGTVVDADAWITSGATQDERISLTGTGSWTNRYIFSRENYPRSHSVVFRARVLPFNATGNQRMMWGVKNSDTNYSYTQMPHAIYFNNGNVHVYENRTNRGVYGTFTRGVLYELAIELKPAGAVYMLREEAASSWTVLYESTASITTSPLKAGATVTEGTFYFDDFTGQGADHYTATLTVEDGAGQLSTASTRVSIAKNLPPEVITVPWVSHDTSIPHETYNGKPVTLKGIVRDADPVTFQWDFGDGTQSALLGVSDPYDLSVVHTYPAVLAGTPFVATLTVWDSTGESGSDTYNIVVKNKSLSVETNIAIDDGLWYLHKSQTRTTTAGYPSGWWRTYAYGTYYSSATAAALQAFEINGHLAQGDHRENPYAETVDRGLKYLFTKLSSYAISVQTYGDPDSNGNSLGIGVNEGYPVYQGGPVMDAIASTKSLLTRTVTGGENIARRTYLDILTDMADMFAWGQDENANGGGWRYNWNDFPDNSAAQWGAIGLQAAEDIFGIPVPQWVKDRNNNWLHYSYNGTGFGYSGYGNGRATTPSGMVELAFDDIQTDDIRWITAENYIASQWSPDDSDSVIYRWQDGEYTRDYYAMYAFVKAMRLSRPHPVVTFKLSGLDWYNDPELGMARCVINDQLAGGRISGSFRSDHHLRTAWGVIILSQTLFIQPPAANAGQDRVWGVNIPLTFDGSASIHLDPFREIVRYEWDFDGDGIYDDLSSSPIATYTYTDDASALPVNYLVTLRVTDNNSPPLTDTDTVVITIAEPPHPPIADPGGPYSGTAGLPVTLDGTGSFDIDPTDSITAYQWELDNIFPFDFDEATEAAPTYTWNTPGTYYIGLRVLDNGVMNDLNHDGIVDEEERLSDQAFTTIIIAANQAPIAEAGGPYTVAEGSPVTLDAGNSSDPNGDPVFYNWDLDNNGGYNDSTGVVTSHTIMDNGIYTIGLEVTDTLLSSTDTAEITVYDLSPQAGFTWTPGVRSEAQAVSFTDQSVSSPDLITEWNWDFAGLGSSGDRNPVFTFNDNGTYPVSLTVTDDDGSTDTITRDILISNAAPEVDAGDDRIVDAGDPVSFSGSFTDPGSLDTHNIAWDFGDGNTASATLTPVHAYASEGTYSVALVVTDNDGGRGEDTLLVTVNRGNSPPVAEAGSDRTIEITSNAGVLVTLDGTGSYDPDGDPLTYTWSGPFGEVTGINPAVTLPIGEHIISLTVSDGQYDDTDTLAINVILPGDTIGVIIKLIDSNGNGIEGGIGELYKDKGIRQEAGITDANGEIHIALLPGKYKFGMEYANSFSYKYQDITADPLVIFTTIKAEVRLLDSNGNGIAGAMTGYHKNTWHNMGSTDANGSAFIELLPGGYSFSVEYLDFINKKYQDLRVDPIIIFTTRMVTVKLLDSNGHGIADVMTKYYNNTWHNIAATDPNGITRIELLPAKYKFGVEYAGVLNYKYQDLNEDPIVVFTTRKVTVKLLDSNGNGIAEAITEYHKDIRHNIGTTDANGITRIELLPSKYKFGVEYAGVLNYKYQDISEDPIIVFTTQNVIIKVLDNNGNGIADAMARYYKSSWHDIGTTDVNGSIQIELLPYIYQFSIVHEDLEKKKFLDARKYNIVAFLY